ncbi:SAV_2336 N-terminal domain-related protein [Streptomyces sp. NPDC021354]|uniref:SAV_2336 N-terminal domain-related protein n=1 Tax=Streptomyces sp. NPDC021354 TaxID=3154793 RepID=UPI0033E389DE
MAGEGRGGRGPQALGQLNDALAILSNSGAELSQEQLLDALWLATRLPAGAAGAAGAGAAGAGAPLERARSAASSSDTSSGTSPDPAAARPRPSVPAASPTSQQPPSRQSRPADGASGLYGAIEPPPAPGAPPPPAARRALPLRVPEAKALRAELPIGRALRPLKQHRPNPLKREVDEVATATALAETGLPDVVTRPARERWLDLALVVDDGMSMLLWRRLAVELRTLLQRAGAFRVVRVLGLHTRGDDAPVLRAKPYVPESPALPVTAVSDPSGHTLVLVLSDGVGAAWRDGRMSAVLERWAGHGPTAVMHALPPRLWEGTGIRAQRWQVRTRRPGSPGTDWTVTDPVLPPELARFDGVPVPVLEPDAGPLADWARLIASASGTAVLPLLAPPRPRRPAAAPSAPAGPGDDLSRLLRFREAASPEAYRLAAHLAAVAPLPVPVMRLVQEAVEWRADTGHLAEVFLGGLMRPAEPPASAGPGPFPPQQRPFTFTDTVRRALLGAVPLPELDETRGLVGRRLKELAGSSPDFPAWLAHPSGADHLPAQARPFGTVEQRLAARLGASPVARAVSLPAHRWRPLRPEDPRTIGPYTLRMTDPSGFRVTTYIGDEDAYGEQVVIHTALAANGPQAADLLRVQAEALRRMDGRYAARLLRQDLDCATPWIAEEPFTAERLSEVPLSGDGDRAFAIARQLADAVRVCAAEGMAHGDLRQSTVYVSDDGLYLTAWSAACVDGVPSPANPVLVPAPQDNVLELAQILLNLGGGARFSGSEVAYDLSHWRGPWRSVRHVVLAALAPDPRDRPTAREVWEAFEGSDPVFPPSPERSAPELTREQRAHGWTPLTDRDPRRLGPCALECHIRTSDGATTYLGRGPNGEPAVLRTVDQESGRRGAFSGLSTEAEALRRMAGRYAPRLLGQDLEGQPPWIAEEQILASDGSPARTLTALLSDGTADGWDARTAAHLGMEVAEAVSLCSAKGMVHGHLTSDKVLVADGTAKLIGWQTAVIDRRFRRLTRRLTPEDDVYALGEILAALGGGRPTTYEQRGINTVGAYAGTQTWTYAGKAIDWAGSRWEGAAWEPLRTMIASCLVNSRRDRPTARESADAFSQTIGRSIVPVRAPLPSTHRVAVLGLGGGAEAARTTLALGTVFAETRPRPVIAVDVDTGLRDLVALLPGRNVEGRQHLDSAPEGLEILTDCLAPATRPINVAANRRFIAWLSERYPLTITHAGATPHTKESALPGVLDLADQLVIVRSLENTSKLTNADATFNWLTAQGHTELLRRSIVVITDVRPDTLKTTPLEYVLPRFDGKCRAVVMIPYDPHLASSDQINLGALRPATRTAYQDLAARLAEGFSPPDDG